MNSGKKNIFFKNPSKNLSFWVKKMSLINKINFKNPRGWLRWFFPMIRNQAVECFFHIEKFRNIDCFRIPKIVQKEYLIVIKSLLYCQPVNRSFDVMGFSLPWWIFFFAKCKTLTSSDLNKRSSKKCRPPGCNIQ